MFDSTSRYFAIEVSRISLIDSDGVIREARYVNRRFIPRDEEMTTLVEHIVTQGDRLDNVTARYVGDSTQFWRLCDANNAMRPDELTDTVGQTIIIALPNF